MAEENYLHSDLSREVIAAYYHVYNDCGYGFLEKVYENSMAITLRKRGYKVLQQEPVAVYFEGEKVGQYFADLIVNDIIIVEIKSARELDEAHEAQLVNYLRATNIEVGLLLNFGLKPALKRKIFTNNLKRHVPNLHKPPSPDLHS